MDKMVSISDLAEWTKKDRGDIRKRLAPLTPIVGDKNAKLYPAHRALELIYDKGMRDTLENRQAEARLRYELARAEMAERELKVHEDTYPHIEHVLEVIAKQNIAVKQHLLVIGYKACRDVAVETNPVKIRSIIDGYVREALTELCESHENKARLSKNKSKNQEEETEETDET